MDSFLTTLETAFTPQTVFSMAGGLLGALIGSDFKRYGRWLSCLFILAAVGFAAAMSDYLVHSKGVHWLWALFGLNVPLGMVVGTSLDVIRIAFPRLFSRLVNSVGNGAVDITANAINDKLGRLLGVDEKDKEQ